MTPMSVPGQSRHFDSAPRTSALPRSTDIADRVRQVRKVPKADLRSSSMKENTSFIALGRLPS